MSKIEEIRDILSQEYPDTNGVSFRQGFDAAMELQLPVLFASFISRECVDYVIRDTEYESEFLTDGWLYIKTNTRYNNKELYDYWLENIYTPEQKHRVSFDEFDENIRQIK